MKKLGFGCMRLPMQSKKKIDIDLFREMVDAAMSLGFNYFDTAYRYCKGMSEPALKEVLVDRYPREAYILTTKLTNEFMKSEEEQAFIFEEQLKRLGQESGYFDYYLIHNQSTVNYAVSKELKSFEFAREKKKEGFIKHIGISFHDTADVLERILSEQPDIEVVQLQINYLDWENESIQSKKCYEVARAHGKRIFVMEPLKGGTLARVSDDVMELLSSDGHTMTPAEWGLKFAASLDGVDIVLSGMNSMEMQIENMSSLDGFDKLNKEEMALVLMAGKLIEKQVSIPCTACGYCKEECPKDIPIPEYLKLVQDKHNTTQVVYYYNYTLEHGRAGDCIKCGLCEKHCPQHIKIRDELEKISKAYDFFKGWR